MPLIESGREDREEREDMEERGPEEWEMAGRWEVEEKEEWEERGWGLSLRERCWTCLDPEWENWPEEDWD